MEYQISKEKSKVSVSVEANAEDWKAAEQEAYRQTKGNYKVSGFRAGHAPKHVIEQVYGAGVFLEETTDNIIQTGFDKFLAENTEISPIDRPSVKIDSYEKDSFKYTISFSVMPEVTLCEYKGIKIPKIEYNVSDAEVEAELNRLLERGAKLEVKSGEAASGDTINFDFKGEVDGVAFDGGTAEKYDLVLGSGNFIPGFEEQLIGAKSGDEKDVNVTFPENYHAENLAGKAAVFHCKVNSVSVKVLPELNDEWAKDTSEFETLEAYRNDTRQKQEKAKAERAAVDKENAVINAITDLSSADIPEVIVEEYLDDMIKDFEMRLYRQGLKLDDYFKYIGSGLEEYKKEHYDEAKRGALTKLCLTEILKRENISVTDEEAESRYKEEAEKYGSDKAATPSDLQFMKNRMTMEKLLKLLTDNAVEE